MNDIISRRLKMLGLFLFLLGLVTGLVIMEFKNVRMGLAAHMEGVTNGTFLVVAGFVWNELKLSAWLKKVLYWTLLYGTIMNWFFTLLSAMLGTSRVTPIGGAGFTGSEWQENLVTAGLVGVGLTMVFSLVVMVYGMRGRLKQ
ncbi:MAG: hydrogenase [Chitinophagaceae bacterium]|nr:hydrogenase [Chitinophagaceae bacterium]MBL0057532.1 hydrogenase [Chitinophagaceae bacterium]